MGAVDRGNGDAVRSLEEARARTLEALAAAWSARFRYWTAREDSRVHSAEKFLLRLELREANAALKSAETEWADTFEQHDHDRQR